MPERQAKARHRKGKRRRKKGKRAMGGSSGALFASSDLSGLNMDGAATSLVGAGFKGLRFFTRATATLKRNLMRNRAKKKALDTRTARRLRRSVSAADAPSVLNGEFALAVGGLAMHTESTARSLFCGGRLCAGTHASWCLLGRRVKTPAQDH